MPYDGLYMRRVIEEINENIKGPLRNIYRPTKVDYYLYFQDGSLRISLNPNMAFMALSEKMKNPSKMPPSFTMLLRKYLKNSRFLGVKQDGFSRVAIFEFERMDEKGDLRIFRLFVELMGKHSNIILVSDENKVIDAHRRIITGKGRELLPGREFVPFTSDKLDPINSKIDDIFKELYDMPIDKFLTKKIEGMSRAIAKEIVHRAGFVLEFSAKDINEGRLERLTKAIEDFREEYSYGKTYTLFDGSEPVDISPIVLHHTAKVHKSLTPSEAVINLVSFKELREILRNKKRDLEKVVVKKIDKLEDVIRKIKEEMEKMQDFEIFRRKGELLMMNAYNLKASDGKVVLKDWESDEDIEIELDEDIDILKNAQRYFDRYKKFKRKYEGMKKRLSEIEHELEYLYQLWQTILDADDESVLDEIKEEMEEIRIVKSKKRKKKKISKSLPRKVNYNGYTILIGKNNRQNDELVRSSSPNDIWLHTRQIPGAHVVIKTQGEVPKKVLEFAASLAAGYSRAKNSSNVPVDYTLIKYVKKPKGFKPGMVIYRNQKTLVVNPRRLD